MTRSRSNQPEPATSYTWPVQPSYSSLATAAPQALPTTIGGKPALQRREGGRADERALHELDVRGCRDGPAATVAACLIFVGNESSILAGDIAWRFSGPFLGFLERHGIIWRGSRRCWIFA